MKFSAYIDSSKNSHFVKVETNDESKELQIESKRNGLGSSINGGEFLFLAIATCFCNDLYREAKKKNIILSSVTVEAIGHFHSEGQPGENFSYRVEAKGNALKEELNQLIQETDKVAEIHNTLRKGVAVKLIQ